VGVSEEVYIFENDNGGSISNILLNSDVVALQFDNEKLVM
jgi:hypothetical protein